MIRAAALVVFAAVLAADQLVKQAVVRALAPGESVPVAGGFLRFTHVRNPGAAFGLFKGATLFLVAAAAGGLVVFVVVLVRRPPAVMAIASALIGGGALGNLADRAFRPWPFRGEVVDFIDFGFWPAFNVADIAITTGAGLLLVSGFLEDRRQKAHPKEDPGGPG
ncbi:MAG TPA: signal peptidase II [Actinomycetota bacterium]|nr:signal peptidase II [Actinomycetota bacterium]